MSRYPGGMGNLSFYEYLDAKADDVVALLDRHPELITGAAGDARGRAESLSGQLTLTVGKMKIDREIKVRVGERKDEPGAYWYRLNWEAEKRADLFPHMEATLEVCALSEETPECQLSLLGDYRPPLGALGAVADLLVMHRIAQATVKTFVESLSRRLKQALVTVPATG